MSKYIYKAKLLDFMIENKICISYKSENATTFRFIDETYTENFTIYDFDYKQLFLARNQILCQLKYSNESSDD